MTSGFRHQLIDFQIDSRPNMLKSIIVVTKCIVTVSGSTTAAPKAKAEENNALSMD